VQCRGGLAPANANIPAVSKWAQDESGRVEHPFEPLILIATLAMIPVIVVERDATSHGWRTFAFAANWVIWAIFAAEMAFILAVARRKGAALRAHWLDAAIVVVTVPAYGRLLSSLRVVRLVRLLRLLRAGVLVARALQAERRLTSANAFRFAALATVFLTVIAGAVQAEIDTRDFHSSWEGLWWAVVTVTTVGYGDIHPETVPGRIVAMVLMFVGLGFLAVLTATIASQFVKTDRADETSAVAESLARLEVELADLKEHLTQMR
jgi:voltage-gated potassium channel